MSKKTSLEKIHIPFEPGKTNPEDFFSSVQKLFNGLCLLQEEVITKTNTFTKVKFYLAEINTGSLIASFIKELITDDEEEGSLNLNSNNINLLEYSNKVQDVVLKECSSRGDKIIEATDIVDISKKIQKIADETNVSSEPNFKQPNVVNIAKSIDSIQKSTKIIPKNKSLEITRNQNTIELEKFSCNVDYDLLTALNQKSVRETKRHTLLKIKTAIFLGNSKWNVILEGGKSIVAKILDEEWIKQFHLRKVPIYPGDYFDADIIIKEKLDDSGNILSTDYLIMSIKGISDKKEA